MSQQPIGILLAAGQSARFGSNKLLYPVMNNTSMILVCAEKLVSVIPDSIVVISRGISTLTTQLEKMGLRVVINESADKGMGSSIACGVRASGLTSDHSSQDAMAWLIMLADMPYIKTETIRVLADKLKNGETLVAPTFDQQRGHPVGFGHCYKNELLALNEDIGARQVLKKHLSELELIPINDEGILMDIDKSSDIRNHENE